jgi:hypothetical protein
VSAVAAIGAQSDRSGVAVDSAHPLPPTQTSTLTKENA